MIHTGTDIDATAAIRELSRVAGVLRAPRLLMTTILDAAKEKAVQPHFRALHSRRNRYGSGFYARYAKSSAITTHVEDGGLSGVLKIEDASGALRHKISGGKVSASRTKYLAIPISEQAKRAHVSPASGVIPGLFFRRINATTGGLFSGKENPVLEYLLKRSVVHKPHPEVMVRQSALAAAAQTACNAFAKKL